jgi:hypothetical protein
MKLSDKPLGLSTLQPNSGKGLNTYPYSLINEALAGQFIIKPDRGVYIEDNP